MRGLHKIYKKLKEYAFDARRCDISYSMHDCKPTAQQSVTILFCLEGARWRSGRASDSESRGPGFEPHKRHRVVSLSKAHLLPTVLVKPRKRWLRPDMTEKLLTGTLSLNTNKFCLGHHGKFT